MAIATVRSIQSSAMCGTEMSIVLSNYIMFYKAPAAADTFFNVQRHTFSKLGTFPLSRYFCFILLLLDWVDEIWTEIHLARVRYHVF